MWPRMSGCWCGGRQNREKIFRRVGAHESAPGLGTAGAGSGRGRLYGRTLDIRRENTRLRSAVGYIQSQVGAAGYSRVALRQGPEGVMLCIPEGASDYETRIFAWEGQLYSQFAAKDAAVDLSDSQALCELSAFSLTARGALLEIRADGKTGFAWCRGGIRNET